MMAGEALFPLTARQYAVMTGPEPRTTGRELTDCSMASSDDSEAAAAAGGETETVGGERSDSGESAERRSR